MKTFANLKEVILLLRQHNVQPLKHLGRSADIKSKLVALYEGIANNTFSSDEEAISALYGADADNSNYRKLKSDLQEKLLDLVLGINIDLEHYSDYQKAYYEAHKQWATIRFLIGQNANSVALTLAGRLLRQSEKFDFTLLSMDIASYLRVQYGLRESNDKRFMEANSQFKVYQKIYHAECLAEELYTTLVVNMVNSRTPNANMRQLATEHYATVLELMAVYQTYKLQMYGYMIGLVRHNFENDYRKTLELCEEAILFFLSRPYEPRVPLQIFYYQQLLAHIHLRQYRDAKQSVKQCIALIQDGTFNWFKFKELHLILMLHVQKYESVEKLLISALEHPRFEFLPDNAKELWRIYESYVNYLILLGKVEKSSVNRFKLGKFINEVPIFSKDKGGLNIAILIIKFLYLLNDRKYNKVIDEVEAIEQYCYRHLRGKNTQRSYVFIKMLLQIPACEFSAEKAELKNRKAMEQLKLMPPQIVNQMNEIEIIPYEELWAFALESLSLRNRASSQSG